MFEAKLTRAHFSRTIMAERQARDEPALHSEVVALKERLRALEERVTELEKELREREQTARSD